MTRLDVYLTKKKNKTKLFEWEKNYVTNDNELNCLDQFVTNWWFEQSFHIIEL